MRKAKWSGRRKPLTDISNNHHHQHQSNGGRLSSRNGINNNNDMKKETTNDAVIQQKQQQQQQQDCLDRLLLVHSHLSSVTRQIDELVAKAIQLKSSKSSRKNKGTKEIESFALFLSDMLSSFKPWIPRFQEVVYTTTCTETTENNLGEFVVAENVSVVDDDDDDEKFEVGTPEETTMDSLISPSPLVSWRPDCNVEQGRQLFLLTPLPMSKTAAHKRRDFPNLVFEMFAPTSTVEAQAPSWFAASGHTYGDLQEGATTIQTPSKLNSVATAARSTFNCGLISTPIFVKRDQSVLVVTPCLKMSPPKSCVILEPISDPSQKVDCNVRKSTPFPVGVHSTISESSSGERPEDLGAKYPELLGIRGAYPTRTGRDIDTSPDWSFSPPKTCVLLEPPTGKVADVVPMDCHVPMSAPIVSEQICLNLKKDFDVQGAREQTKISNEDIIGASLARTEHTPIWKEPERTMRTGRRPGENTLKKELWTKFEAASTYGLRLSGSAFQGTAKKGFLDMLDEVSCDGESIVPGGLSVASLWTNQFKKTS